MSVVPLSLTCFVSVTGIDCSIPPCDKTIFPVPSVIFSLNVKTTLLLTVTNLLSFTGSVLLKTGASMSAVSKVNVVPLNLLPVKSVIAVLASLSV